ncbi:MAG: SAM-dependent methyltransferase [Thermoprotei archaeon]|nr:MAG: SAM-dependent methyltransferase [Thermoprotei archaeon]
MLLEIYQFHPKLKLVIPGFLLKDIVNVFPEGKHYVSLDLGFSLSIIRKVKDKILFDEFNEELDLDHIKKLRIKDDSVYVIEEGRLRELSLYGNGKFYRLIAVKNCKAPTLEISGIHMHRIKNICPWNDSLSKVRLLGVREGDLVLDVCTGLGYTAIASLRYGASKVYTIEIDENVLSIASFNPWSKFLESNKITIFLGNAFDVIDVFKNNVFDKVIHDPPRFSLAGELYSGEFYHKLFRVIKPGGKLFHYIGKPGEAIGRKSMTKGVVNRLREVGFFIIRKTDFGIVAKKPRF